MIAKKAHPASTLFYLVLSIGFFILSKIVAILIRCIYF
jgi:hypothetical protein